MKSLPICLLLLFIISAESFPSTQDSTVSSGYYDVVIDSIEITGNDITQDFIILRELTFGIGDTLNHDLAIYNRERIYSLGIFNDVRLKPYQVGQTDILKIEIDESWYIYPLPFVQLTDKDWDKITYGVNVLWKNFRGRNETVRGRASFGYDPSYSFAYLNPNLSYNLSLYLNSQFVFTKAENRSSTAEELYGSNFNQDFYSGRVTFGKRFGLFHRFGISGGFEYIETPFYISGINASDDRIDRTVILGAAYSYDTRDLIQFPTDGIYTLASFELKGMGINNIRYRVANIDFREYRTFFHKLTTKWRFAARHTGGELVPYYDYSFLGLSERIRGYFYGEEREGNDLLYTSVEFNYPIIEETRIDLYFIPLLPRSLLTYRVALYSGLFADTGTTRMDGEPLKIKNFDTGYGTGLSLLLLPYMILRFEFAINDNGHTEWIFDLGASF